MKRNRIGWMGAAILLLSGIGLSSRPFEAEALETDGKVKVTPSDVTDPLDPENPLEIVDPGESGATEGDLRIDFVSAINFANTEITQTNRHYHALGQLFHGATPARGNYIQVTDLREGSTGWSLQLKQVSQFKNQNQIELAGAVLSFDHVWANSGGTGESPNVFSDTISLGSIGNAYEVASAAKGTGNGTWLISFGASSTDHFNQPNTLTTLKDTEGQVVMDAIYDKPHVTNSAISLSVPDKTTILPGEYGTELLWILQSAP